MKVVVDDKIPYIQEAIKDLADEVVFLSGKDISSADVKEADALIVRTRTRCDEALLTGSRVKFIATATIGYDHIDVDYCKKNGITWINAPGCNSSSVAQYLESVFILLQRDGVELKGKTIGIIGGGNVGRKIISLSEKYGLRALLNDLPREEVEYGVFYSIDKIMELADIITFHVPLNRSGRFNTFHLADEVFFSRLKKQPIIINTSRGEVIKTQALLEAIEKRKVGRLVLDVWENEPDINVKLLEYTFIGTPHIAGYSADGKSNASQMVIDELSTYFKLKNTYKITPPVPENAIIKGESIEDCLLKIYNPLRDNDLLKSDPAQFEILRGNYPLRREKKAYTIELL